MVQIGGRALILLVLCSLQTQAIRRNLAEITYRFTDCESAEHDGPRVINQCKPLYEQMNSPLLDDPLTLFQFENNNGLYDGAQGFRLPKTDIYNVTLVGARGGEGLCNFQYGKGIGVKLQVELTTDYEYLIMVGHRGTSVCEVEENTANPVCQEPRPTTLEEAQTCNDTWYNFTRTLPNSNLRYMHNGAGGGGGASMILPRIVGNEQFLPLPLVITPGGGGASAILDYEFLANSLPENFSFPRNASSDEIYRFHANGHVEQYYLIWPEGARGERLNENEPTTSGSGGGWRALLDLEELPVDGRLLSQRTNFAQGGFDCSARLNLLGANVFTNVFGGYGGGGGGCGSGGGGGGYTGGHVVSNDNRIPGSGGDLGVINDTLTVHLDSIFTNDDDGYVEIVASNCECAGQCEVFTEERQFECYCPNDSLLAPDGSNCYKVQELSLEEGVLVILGDGVSARELRLNTSVGVLGVSVGVVGQDVGVVTGQVGEQPLADQCVLALFGEGLEQILLSETISGSGTIDTLSVISLDASGNVSVKSEAVSLLQSPVTVTTMILLSSGGDCRLVNNTIQANISIITPVISGTNVLPDDVILSALFNRATQTEPTLEVSKPTTSTELVVGASLGLIIGVVMVIIITAIIVGVVCRKKAGIMQKRSLIRQLSVKRRHQIISNGPGTGAIEFNSAYSAYQPSPMTSTDDFNHTYEMIQMVYTQEAIVETIAVNTSSDIQFQTVHGISMPDVDFCSYNKQRSLTSNELWSYPRAALTYMRELGEGQFGKVLLMKATDIAGYQGKIPVAVKTLTSRDPDIIQKFVEEAELMKKFTHTNIVSLLGFSEQEEGEDSAPLMILEYMQYGDLHHFLVDNRPEPGKPSPLKKLHFYTFTYDIAKGLAFLSGQQYVHRDIAARNCLVGSGLQIKIADFGLARGVNNKDYYRIAGSAVLPVRWMSPESLFLGKFSSASDVWAYGVVVWEILMFGQLPLPNKDTQDIVKAAQNKKLEHSKPQHAPEDLCLLMSSCHQWEVEERPSFDEIVAMELFNVVNQRPSLHNSQTVEIDTESPEAALETTLSIKI